ncbi:hypothetical protein CSUB01_10690 [Colletotrichum sublineola]|uniref:Uncharacterized protein n=1 Tax=Colletotrichum sublineola TaxID=1173701 RepID=A0A066XSF8_COLSU|nr:hypothetical protein CSUB01_10690 [Colletotrichum sublineola]
MRFPPLIAVTVRHHAETPGTDFKFQDPGAQTYLASYSLKARDNTAVEVLYALIDWQRAALNTALNQSISTGQLTVTQQGLVDWPGLDGANYINLEGEVPAITLTYYPQRAKTNLQRAILHRYGQPHFWLMMLSVRRRQSSLSWPRTRGCKSMSPLLMVPVEANISSLTGKPLLCLYTLALTSSRFVASILRPTNKYIRPVVAGEKQQNLTAFVRRTAIDFTIR